VYFGSLGFMPTNEMRDIHIHINKAINLYKQNIGTIPLWIVCIKSGDYIYTRFDPCQTPIQSGLKNLNLYNHMMKLNEKL
jgi:hypothetical protein